MPISDRARLRTYALASAEGGVSVRCVERQEQTRSARSIRTLADARGSEATDGHLPNHQCRRCDGRTELQVGPHSLQIEEHLAQIRGNGDLRYRICELAVLNPQPGGATRVIAGDYIDAGPDQLRNVEPLADSPDDLIGRAPARLDIEIPLADMRTPGEPAAGVPRGAQP